MKARYKLGTFISFTSIAEGQQTGIIDGVITRKDGFSYALEGRTDTVAENDIVTAYRELKPRAPQKRRMKTGSVKRVKTPQAQEEATF